ncbi:MAG: OmpH family outer membrane protein [Rubricoccaceae bacterium]
MRTLPCALSLLVLLGLLAPAAAAQQRIAYIDSEVILQRLPAYQTAQQEVERLAQQWRAELDEIAADVERLQQDYAARELLYTADERTARRAEIDARRQALAAARQRYFGPDGELLREQQARLRPVQEQVLEAVERVALADNFDYVFDRSGDFLFLYTRPQFNLTERVLEELGVSTAPGAR